jgi:hypothetical protein
LIRVTTAVGERERVEKRSALDLEPPIAGRQSLRVGGHGAARLLPTLRLLFISAFVELSLTTVDISIIVEIWKR